MADLLVVEGADFNSTEATVEPRTAAGRKFFTKHFGAAAVSVTLPKSGLVEMGQIMADEGLTLG